MPKSINRWDVSGQYVRGPSRLGGSGLKETVLKLPNPKFAQFTALTLNEFFEGYEQEIARLQARVQELERDACPKCDKSEATAYECKVHRWFGVGICPECRTMPSIQNSQLWTNTALSMAGCVSTQVFRDEQGDGCDISAGLYGPHLSAFISQIAFLLDEYCPPATLKNVLNQFKAE